MNLVTVATYRDPQIAQLARSRLEVDGIEAFVADDAFVQMDWLYSMALGGVKVRVDESDAERAIAILHEEHHATAAADDIGGSDNACPQCQSAEVSFYRLSGLGRAASLLTGLPLEWPRRRLRCGACGSTWRRSGRDLGLPDPGAAARLRDAEIALRMQPNRRLDNRQPLRFATLWPIVLLVMIGLAVCMLFMETQRDSAF